MALLSEQDRQALRTRLAEIAEPVTLLFFTQTIGEPETALMTKQILGEVAGLSDRVSVEEVNFILEKDRADALGITGVPAVAVLRGGIDARMRFLGAPAGYEFVSLVEAIVLAGGTDSGLSQESRTLIATHVTEPRHQGFRHADLPALPAGSDARASHGIRASAHPGDVRRSH